ncbi:MAG: hydrogenase formation protein HypD [Candidatus Omnitrophota bacterium]|nr:hydrogenase formation protein HypD [Candidatus Omnitrophota bacterium]
MKYIDEFRDKKLIQRCARNIGRIIPVRQINIMEVCGTHTQNFYRFGLAKIIPENLRLIAGPGCPVCVSSQGYIDAAIALAGRDEAIIVTFGDMLRVLGSSSSLEKQRAKSGNVRLAYSPLESIAIAKRRPEKKVIFLAVGFETTAPAIALTIAAAKKEKLKNLFFLTALKLILPAMEYLARDKKLNLDGFLCPGHVSAIIGAKAYTGVAKKYGLSCCVAGFEPLDILEGLYLLLLRIKRNKPGVDNQYSRVVKDGGNPSAKRILCRVFTPQDADWRGLGNIPGSGLGIRREFSQFDAAKHFSLREPRTEQPLPAPASRAGWGRQGAPSHCRCADVLKGLIGPKGCPLFGKACRPDNPIGPCMVSNEGACNAHYRYNK